jgi:SAM-dependent methyltransferase
VERVWSLFVKKENMNYLSHEELLSVSPEDKALFDQITNGLPTREGYSGDYYDRDGKEIPYGSEAHVLKHIRTAIEIVQPKSVLEIGLNRGHGSAMFLALSKAKVVSIDISDRRETIFAGTYLQNMYPERFMFFIKDSGFAIECLRGRHFDLCFIDGGHDEASVLVDINLCENLKIPYLLFDDCYPRYGEVLKAIGGYGDDLTLIKDMDNIRLYKSNWK